MAQNGKVPQPVEGETIQDSPLKTLSLCLLAIFVLAPVGGGVVWAWWTGYSFLDRQIAWYGAFLGAVFVLGGIMAVPVSVLCFFRRNQLILGKECLQIVRGGTVTIQIPYQNIARIEMAEAEVYGKFIGIDLREPKESGTVCPGAEATKNGFGWHYALSDESWTVPLGTIHERIVKRLPSGSTTK
jgi:hypothetical protein